MEDNTLNTDRQARVAERAYDRYLARGAQDGQDLDDWLEAERELASEESESQETPATASVSARMDTSVAEVIARQDPDSAEGEASYERPPMPSSRRGGRGTGRSVAPTHP